VQTLDMKRRRWQVRGKAKAYKNSVESAEATKSLVPSSTGIIAGLFGFFTFTMTCTGQSDKENRDA
jgi:hypothetical protein